MADGNPNTAWVEGDAEYGIGESITFAWDGYEDCTLYFFNGYQKNEGHMEKNSRVKTMDVYVDDHLMRKLEIQDRMGPQKFSGADLGFKPGQNIKMVITGVYKGTKWKDTCISEIGVISPALVVAGPG